ncbi:hypothetical protein GCM10011588_47380 [Nocardia jinanensis]|uniref:Uncharacterized protein n=1 Tax=Nocardia jinanensis TaxID=382504 RepID=A0A917VVK9_9NOCA|nr:hypothetical protein GCM10011588_47380 [Nocardia jinanensis]
MLQQWLQFVEPDAVDRVLYRNLCLEEIFHLVKLQTAYLISEVFVTKLLEEDSRIIGLCGGQASGNGWMHAAVIIVHKYEG